MSQAPAPPYKFESPDHHTIIRFELVRNGAFFHVKVQDSWPLWFTIDSGAATTYIDSDIARRIGLQAEGKAKVQGAGRGKVEVEVFPNVAFHLHGLQSWDHRVHGVSLSGISEQWGQPLHGFFGYDFLERFVATIDYGTHQIRLEDPSSFTYNGIGAIIPLEFEKNLPFVHASIRVPGRPAVEDLFLIDSGSQDNVDHPVIAKSAHGTEATLGGVGLGIPSTARLGRVELLQLGPFEIRETTGVATEKGLGSRLIGCGILSRFKVIFDYQRRRMILEPL